MGPRHIRHGRSQIVPRLRPGGRARACLPPRAPQAASGLWERAKHSVPRPVPRLGGFRSLGRCRARAGVLPPQARQPVIVFSQSLEVFAKWAIQPRANGEGPGPPARRHPFPRASVRFSWGSFGLSRLGGKGGGRGVEYMAHRSRSSPPPLAAVRGDVTREWPACKSPGSVGQRFHLSGGLSHPR